MIPPSIHKHQKYDNIFIASIIQKMCKKERKTHIKCYVKDIGGHLTPFYVGTLAGKVRCIALVKKACMLL